MRPLIAALALGLCLFQFVSSAFAKDTMEARIAAATAHEKIVPVEGMIDDMFAEIQKNPQSGLTDSDVGRLRALIDVDEFRLRVINNMAKHFTVGELNALSDFYSNPEGKSVMKKMPAYMSDMMPYMQAKMMEAFKLGMQERAKQKKNSDNELKEQ